MRARCTSVLMPLVACSHRRQALNVFRMRLLGAEVRPVHSGTATLKDATSEAIRDWVSGRWVPPLARGPGTAPAAAPSTLAPGLPACRLWLAVS